LKVIVRKTRSRSEKKRNLRRREKQAHREAKTEAGEKKEIK
jgi:hypothetical protein